MDGEWLGYGSFLAMLFWVLIWCAVWGSVCALIAQAKHRSVKAGYLWGFFLGAIGLSVVALQAPGNQPLPSPRPGWVARRCPRCNAVHNVKVGAERFDCWRCSQGCKV